MLGGHNICGNKAMTMRLMKPALLGALLCGLLQGAAWAQEYPAKMVKIISTFPVGSGPDVALRVIAERLGKQWGKSVIVENKPGASGFIAVESAKRAAPDGYTLLQMDNAQMSAQPFLFKKLPYDLLKDFEPITPILRNYFFLTVPVASPYQTTGDLLKAAKARPGSINYGSWFVGSPGHLGGAMLEEGAGVEMVHVPYKEMSQLYASVGNQEISWAFGSAASAGPMQRAGKIRYLAVSAPKRVAGFPDVPTISESGGPANFEVSGSVALLAPKGTSRQIVEKIQRDVAAVLKEPEVLERYATLFYEPYALNTEHFLKQLKAESQLFGQTIKRLNISLD